MTPTTGEGMQKRRRGYRLATILSIRCVRMSGRWNEDNPVPTISGRLLQQQVEALGRAMNKTDGAEYDLLLGLWNMCHVILRAAEGTEPRP